MRDYFNTGYNMAQYVFAYIPAYCTHRYVVVGELEFLDASWSARSERGMPESCREACNDLKEDCFSVHRRRS